MEWDDPGFGARAAAVHKRLTAALAADAGGPGEAALAGISAQMALMAQLRHLSSELRVRDFHSLRTSYDLRWLLATIFTGR